MRNLDSVVNDYFAGSEDEDVVGSVCLQPLICVDDLLRCSQGVQEVRNGNQKLAKMIQEMCLEIHPTKCSYVVVGTTKFKKEVKETTDEDNVWRYRA